MVHNLEHLPIISKWMIMDRRIIFFCIVRLWFLWGTWEEGEMKRR